VTIKERFFAKTKLGDIPDHEVNTPCLEWTGCTCGGYGRFRLQRRNVQAHRVAWIMENGVIEAGLCVCHKCDNRKCVRVDHLFLGTLADNNHDMIKKGRYKRIVFGEEHGQSKLTDEKVRTIFRLRRSGWTTTKIGLEVGVHHSHVSRVLARKLWAHVHVERGCEPITDTQKAEYEIAALALEKFAPHTGPVHVVVKAYQASAIESDDSCRGDARQWVRHTKRAACLLRACIKKGESLPC
jgi:hypothetical protein